MPELARSRVTKEGASPTAWIYVLHGIYGAGRNWASVARELVRRRGGWGALLVDLRLHGDSRGFGPPHTVEACARDVEALADASEPAPLAVLGHSFGGKVALSLIGDALPGLLQAWVVDCDPGARPPGGAAVEMLRAVRSLPGPFEERGEAIAGLEARGFDRVVAAWMATDLERADDGLRWRLDLEEVEALLADFFRTDLWPVVEAPPEGVELHFVKAEGSDALPEAAGRRIEAASRESGRVRLHRVAGGHWVNADNPDALLELLTSHLPRRE